MHFDFYVRQALYKPFGNVLREAFPEVHTVLKDNKFTDVKVSWIKYITTGLGLDLFSGAKHQVTVVDFPCAIAKLPTCI